MFSKIVVTLLSLPLLISAAPARTAVDSLRGGAGGPLGFFTGCPVSNFQLTFPAGQTALSIPEGQKPNHILLGSGVQNYTCTDAGAYASAGAVAKLYDISCLVGTPAFATIQDTFHKIPAPIKRTIQAALDRTPFLAVDHYFVQNPITNSGISPKFALHANGGREFAIEAKVAGIAAPNTANIDFLQLNTIQGTLGKTVFRVDTVLGQPPKTCTPGSAPISVAYTSKYLIYA